MCLAIEERALLYTAAQHFFKTHCLRAKLRRVAVPFLWLAALVLHGEGQPSALPPAQLYAVIAAVIFKHITLPGYAEPARGQANPMEGDHIAALLAKRLIMRSCMQERAVNGTKVLRPLVFDMNQRPLPAAKQEVLQPGKLEIILLVVFARHGRKTTTPSGMAASSTATS